MLALSVDATNDLYLLPTGNLATARDLTACMQACAQAVKAQAGEMIYAADQGMPNFRTVWKGAPNLLQFEAAVRRTLLSVPNVTAVVALSAQVRDNAVVYSATIQTIYGVGTLNG